MEYDAVLWGIGSLFILSLGLVMGSFCNAFAWRFVRQQSILQGRSRCAACGHVLSAKELIPVVSWLMQKGHCRHCGAVISWRYPLVEVLTAGIFFSLAVCYTYWQQLLLLLCLSCLLVLIALVDYESWLIPDIFITVGIVLYLLLQMLAGAALQPLVLSSLLRGCSVAVPLLIFVMIGEKIWKKPVMGGGDIKLFFLLGLYLGPMMTALTLFCSCLVGLLWQGIQQQLHWAKPFPFAPSIAIAAWLVLLWGQPMMDWYLQQFI